MPSPALADAIARVRTVFAGMTSPDEEGCTHCHDPEETRLLRTAEITVPARTVQYYLAEVPDHFTDHAASIRRLLPDLVTYLVSGEVGFWPGNLMGFGRSGWQEWPAEQRDAVAGFLEAWWSETLRAEDPSPSVDELFQLCVSASSTVTPYLARWAAQPQGGTADRHLAETVDGWTRELAQGGDVIAYWTPTDRPVPVGELAFWLLDHAHPRLEAMGATADARQLADELLTP